MEVRSIDIGADAASVWRALTDTSLMRQWAGDPCMNLDVVTDWEVGKAFVVRGIHHVEFENTGTVLHFQPPTFLQYTHLSSTSRLPDEPGSYTRIAFRLSPLPGGATRLDVELENFPTEAIFRHLDFYWRITLGVLKQFVEGAKAGQTVLP